MLRRVAAAMPLPAQRDRRPRPGVPVSAEDAGPRGVASGWGADRNRRHQRAADSGGLAPRPLTGAHADGPHAARVKPSATICDWPVSAIFKCPLFRSSGAACRTPCHKGWGQAHRLQAAGGQRYGERAEVPGGAGYALRGRGLLLHVCLSCRTPAGWAAASLKAAAAERNTGVPLSSAPRGFPWAGRGPAGRIDRSGRDGPEAAPEPDI